MLAYNQIAWLVAGTGLLIVELVALVRGDPLLTDAMRAGAQRWLLWPAIFGVLSGHFFGIREGPTWGPWVIAGLAMLVLARDLGWGSNRIPVPSQLELFLLFVALGAWLWGARA